MGVRFVFFVLALFLLACLKVANLASFLPDHQQASSVLLALKSNVTISPTPPPQPPTQVTHTPVPTGTRTTTAAQFNQTPNQDIQNSSLPTTTLASTNVPPTTTTTIATTTVDPDSDEITPTTPIQLDIPTQQTPTDGTNINNNNNNKSSNDKIGGGQTTTQSGPINIELTVLFYSIFLVYVSVTKLIYHNVTLIKRNLTEPGILMIFGIIWELVTRQISNNYNAFPRFNSRVFFYLFLPSTVLESASILSNKWLFVNMLPILFQSIVGTLSYAASLGFTIYSLSRQNVFELMPVNSKTALPLISQQLDNNNSTQFAIVVGQPLINSNNNRLLFDLNDLDLPQTVASASASDSTGVMDLNNLTLADCLVFGTILSSIDSTTMLGVFQTFQANEKLYYLVIGENLMNNAVVLVIFDLLLDFFSATRLTVVKIYMAIIQFFITLIGSIFIGLILAALALGAVHLTKRLKVTTKLSSYQYQCQAMVETLLILKLAYLTYTLAALAGTSSILSLATFGILQDQYIKHNLNLRSQLTFRQIILATKTMGYSLVYPLLGMLLVEVANTEQFFQGWSSFSSSSHYYSTNSNRASFYSAAASKLSHLAQQANLGWNWKFLSLVILFTIIFRFTVVIVLSFLCNLFSSRQLSIKFREQILVAYGGLKGPLAFALVTKLIEHEEYRDRTLKNKHLFMYTILFITFISTLFKGSLVKFLVMRLTQTNKNAKGQPSEDLGNTSSTLVFDKINEQVLTNLLQSFNSVLGHTKSPYERFVDFNELQLKPWLARKGTNTNWLSVYYDNLILDETLNANCFYKSATIHATTTAYHRSSSLASNGILEALQQIRATSHKKRSRIEPLDTIDENGSLVIGPPVRRATPQVDRRNLSSDSLKEFVMLDLKLEDAKRRRSKVAKSGIKQVQNPTLIPGPSSQVTRRPPPSPSPPPLPKVMRMLSSTSSEEDGMALTVSSIEMVEFDSGEDRPVRRDEPSSKPQPPPPPPPPPPLPPLDRSRKSSVVVAREPIKKRQATSKKKEVNLETTGRNSRHVKSRQTHHRQQQPSKPSTSTSLNTPNCP